MKTQNKRRSPLLSRATPPENQRRVQASGSRGGGLLSNQVTKDSGTTRSNKGSEGDKNDKVGKGHGQLLSSPVQNEAHGSELSSMDLDAVKEMIQETEKHLVRHVNLLFNKLVARIDGTDSMLTDLCKSVRGIDSNVSCLKKLVTQHASALARQNGTARNFTQRNTNGPSFRREIEAKFPGISLEIQAVFTSGIFCRSGAQAVLSYMEACHKVQDDIRMTARNITVLLYGLKRDMSRNAFKSGTGRHHANFRFNIAKTAVRSALRISDETSKKQEQDFFADALQNWSEGSESPMNMNPSSGKPTWLTPQVLNGNVLEMARKYRECVKAELDPMPRDTRQRKGLHISRHVVKSTIDMLRISRDRCKTKMFEAGVFLLSDWSTRQAFKDGHCNPNVRFVHPTAIPMQPERIEDCLMESEEGYQMSNSGLLKEMLISREEMLVEGTYNVTVVLNKNARARHQPHYMSILAKNNEI